MVFYHLTLGHPAPGMWSFFPEFFYKIMTSGNVCKFIFISFPLVDSNNLSPLCTKQFGWQCLLSFFLVCILEIVEFSYWRHVTYMEFPLSTVYTRVYFRNTPCVFKKE